MLRTLCDGHGGNGPSDADDDLKPEAWDECLKKDDEMFWYFVLRFLLKLSLYSIVSKSLGCALSLSFHIRLNDLDAFAYPSCSALFLCEQPLFSMFSAISGHSSFLGHT